MRGFVFVTCVVLTVAHGVSADEFTYDLAAGWSLISLPLVVADPSVDVLFPSATSLFEFVAGSGYESVALLEHGRGYWINVPVPTTRTIIGAIPASMQVELPADWSLVGTLAAETALAELGENVVSLFGFDGGYESATGMVPGAGYWVNLSAEDTIDLAGNDNVAPVADAGADQTAGIGAAVTLDGSASSDPNDDTLTYSWTEDGGNPVTGLLSDATVVSPSFTPTVVGTYAFVLVVNDGTADSEPDTAVVVAETPLLFPDASLEAAIRDAIGRPSGAILAGDVVGLEGFDASGRDIDGLLGIENLVGLRTLWLNDNNIIDISPLSSLTQLEALFLDHNYIVDISSLSSLTQLTLLFLNGNHLSDISSLSSLTQLSILRLAYSHLSDISSLSSLTQLTRLYLDGNQVIDIGPLSSLTQLSELFLAGNQVTDIGPLSSLTRLIRLSLGGNQVIDISSLSSLTQLSELHLYGNQIEDISALVTNTGIDTGDEVQLQNNPLNADAYSTHVPALQARGVHVSLE